MSDKLLDSILDIKQFSSLAWSEKIYGLAAKELKAGYQISLGRIQALQVYLGGMFVGEGMRENIRMLLACAIAQEPVLFIGGPGLAKTELAIAFFESIGLRKPTAQNENEGENKYYEYLMSAFTLPEELFGPYIVGEGGLKSGKFIRNNENMLSGPGIRGCFLDEVFKGSSNILNTMLTLINERRYFNNGMFHQADLAIIAGASNTTPATSVGGLAGDFQITGKAGGELLAFYDRFTIRLHFKAPETSSRKQIVDTEWFHIRQKALERERVKLNTGKLFQFEQKASINDILLLSRILFASPSGNADDRVIAAPEPAWVENFLSLGMKLARQESSLVRISPRKLTRLEKIAYALALLDHQAGSGDAPVEKGQANNPDSRKIAVQKQHYEVFKHIWESEHFFEQLGREVDLSLKGLNEKD